MKFVLLTLEYPPFYGGVANYYFNLVKNWPASDSWQVVDDSQHELLLANAKVWPWRRTIVTILKLLKQKQLDQLVVGQILPLGNAAWLVSLVKKLPFTVVLHGVDLALACSSPRKLWLTKKILAAATWIICANSQVANLAKTILPPSRWSKIKIINPGINPDEWTPAPAAVNELRARFSLTDKIILLTVGRLVERKGVDQVLLSLPQVLIDCPDLCYIIIGSGEQADNYRSLIQQLNLSGQVQLLTAVSEAEKKLWYQACDIFIMTARQIGVDFEGFGIVYLEAGASGKPVIAGSSGGVGDAVANEINGLLVKPDDHNEIARSIVKLAQYPGLRARLGEQGRLRATEKFNWRGQVAKFYQLFHPEDKI